MTRGALYALCHTWIDFPRGLRQDLTGKSSEKLLIKSLKSLLLAALVCLPVFHHCGAAEMRTVGNTEVDLQPLIDWTAKKKGERPLKHWKLVQVLEQKRQSASPVLLCDIEGLKSEIMLRNCPKELLSLL